MKGDEGGKRDDDRRDLFSLSRGGGGEPARCLSHCWEGRVDISDFVGQLLWSGGGGNAVEEELRPPGAGGDWAGELDNELPLDFDIVQLEEGGRADLLGISDLGPLARWRGWA